jgi:hypothetical protein
VAEFGGKIEEAGEQIVNNKDLTPPTPYHWSINNIYRID